MESVFVQQLTGLEERHALINAHAGMTLIMASVGGACVTGSHLSIPPAIPRQARPHTAAAPTPSHMQPTDWQGCPVAVHPLSWPVTEHDAMSGTFITMI